MTRARGSLVLGGCLLALALADTQSASAEVPPAQQPVVQSPAPPPPEAPPAPPQEQGAPPATPPADERLSNERTTTTWAHPVSTLPIYSRPDPHSRTVARVHLETEDGFPEVYLLLVSHTDSQGRAWIRLRVPGRPNGRTGWVLRSALGGFHETHWLLVVSLGGRRLTAYLDGRRRLVAPVGVGKPSTPTPAGHFWIRERFHITSRSNPYWPYALGTSDYSTLSEWPGGGVVGIHGDFGEPQLIPGDPSHGCIRMRDSDLAWLAPRLELGTPVDIVQ
ncbi:MAG TPA: L,D-transpeptidase [Solirubrobacteraceae bacterium]|nr:L,D-transpeptidase [Solirubrobacteraceae bacterium]